MKRKVSINDDNSLVIYAILELGNDILASLGVEEIIDDVGVFFRYLTFNFN